MLGALRIPFLNAPCDRLAQCSYLTVILRQVHILFNVLLFFCYYAKSYTENSLKVFLTICGEQGHTLSMQYF